MELLPPKDVVEVPIGALVEDGKDSIVFVQTDPKEPVYTMRRVEVTDRFDRTAYVRSVPVTKKGEDRAAGDAGQASLPTEPLKKGERVVTTGALELQVRVGEQAIGERQACRCENALKVPDIRQSLALLRIRKSSPNRNGKPFA